MFRVSVLSIVLALAIGPDAAIMCRALCVGETDAAAPCDHGAAGSPIVAADDCCDELVRDLAAVLVKDVRQRTSDPNGDRALPVLQDQFVTLASVVRPDRENRRPCSLDNRPLATALRI